MKYRNITWVAIKVKSRPIKISFYTKDGREVKIKATETYDALEKKIKKKP